MVPQMIFSVVSHELHRAASNGVLNKAVKTLSKMYPEYASFIKSRSTEQIFSSFGIDYSFARINEVAKAFRANRASIGVKEAFSTLA